MREPITQKIPMEPAKAPRARDAMLSHGGTYILMCALIMAADISSGPGIMLAITYVIPVALAAWYRGYAAALGIAIVLPLCRIAVAVLLEASTPLHFEAISAAIRIAVLWLVARLVTTTGRHTRELENEVKILEGILPICSHCKKIRDEKQQWQPLEGYITDHSEAMFTHSICPGCMRKHYGEFAANDAEPGKPAP